MAGIVEGAASNKEPPPNPVKIAVGLLFANLAVSVLQIPSAIRTASSTPTPGLPASFMVDFLAIFLPTVIGFYVLIAVMLLKRRNWARILIAVLVVIGAPFVLIQIFSGAAPLGQIISSALQWIAVGFLFAPGSVNWFKSGKR